MSIPQNAKDLRRALDRAQLFTHHIPAQTRGYMHQLRVRNPVVHPTKEIMVMVQSSRYHLFGEGYDNHKCTTINETVEEISKVLG
jgi:hypothetical protein